MIALRNVGTQAAPDVRALLRTSDAWVSVLDSECVYAAIDPDSLRTNAAAPFRLTAAPGCPLEHEALLELILSGTFNDTITLRVVVGEIRAQDPIPDGQPGQYWAYDECDTLYDQHPDFSWIEINGIGTPVTLSDDQTVTINLPLGFSWQYYGQTHTQLSICGNGFVAPGWTTTSTYTNTALPSVLMPPLVALLWDDMYPPTGNGVWYYHDQANGRFIVEYDSIAYYANQAQRAKYQFILYDTLSAFGNNAFVAQYLACDDFGSATIGIQDPSLTIAIQCLFDGTRHRGSAPFGVGRAVYYCDQAPLTGLEGGSTVRTRGAFRTWPNPFRCTVTLDPALAGSTGASVYDQSGRLVRSISGNGALVWDGRDDSGRLVAPGVYFCRPIGASPANESKLVLTR